MLRGEPFHIAIGISKLEKIWLLPLFIEEEGGLKGLDGVVLRAIAWITKECIIASLLYSSWAPSSCVLLVSPWISSVSISSLLHLQHCFGPPHSKGYQKAWTRTHLAKRLTRNPEKLFHLIIRLHFSTGHIHGDQHLSCKWVIAFIPFLSSRITHKDALQSLRIQFTNWRFMILSKTYTSKDARWHNVLSLPL